MVVTAFPLAKIGLLLMKQLSKPVANVIKQRAKKHPSIRKYAIIPIGRGYHWIETAAIQGKAKSTAHLTEDEVVELGANAVGEIALFGLLTVLLLVEYNRMGDKKAILKKMKEDEMTNLVSIVVETIEEVNNLKKTIKKIEGQISTAYDAIQFEEEHHPFVQDNDFLDVMLRRKGNVQQKSKERLDEISPSS